METADILFPIYDLLYNCVNILLVICIGLCGLVVQTVAYQF